MEITGVTAAAATMTATEAKVGDGAAIAAFKKADQIHLQTSLQLIASVTKPLPTVQQPSNPSHLGNSVDTVA